MNISSHNPNGPVVLVSRRIQYSFPLSYAYLAGYLLHQNERVQVLFRQRDNSALVRQIMELNPLLVGFGSLYPELQEIRNIINLLNEAGRRFPIVIGGQMVSPIPEFSLLVTGADFGVLGEGEIILYQLVSALRNGDDPSDIKGLAIRQGNDVHLTGSGPFIRDLSQLPPVPYHLFPENEWLEIGRWYTMNCPQPHWRFTDRAINVHGGRGCPFQCNFCYHHSPPRYRPVDLMLSEAEESLKRFQGNMLYFSDDLVLGSPRRAKELVTGLANLRQSISYSVSTRFDILKRLDDDLLGQMKETGCRIMGLGIESGSDRILKIIGKNTTSEDILQGLNRLKQVGILPTVSMMVGQVDETMDDINESLKLMRQSVRENPNIQYSFTIMTPFPGSPVYRHIMTNGLLKDDKEFYDKYFSRGSTWNLVVNLSQLSDNEVLAVHAKMESVYRQEQANSMGRALRNLTSIRKTVSRLDKLVENRVIHRIPRKGIGARILSLYSWVRNLVYSGLEDIDLMLRGFSRNT